MSAESASSEKPGFWNFVGLGLSAFMTLMVVYWVGSFFAGQLKQVFGGDEEAETQAVAAAAPAAAEESAPAPAAEAPTDAPAGEAPKTAAAEKPAKPAAAPASGEVSEVLLKPDPANPLAYDVKAFSVKANSTVKLTFENIHPTVPQPHNVVIGVPGSKDKILAAAMQLAADPQGMAKGYIPESEDVLFHTKLLQPGQTEVLEFAAPAAGQYPYVCTFPGHGILMNGIMTVE